MSTVVWTTLITAAATVAAALGAVWTRGHFDDRAEARKAREASLAEVSERRRNAYASLLTTAREFLTEARRRQASIETTGDPRSADFAESRDLVADVTSAELLGSARAHPYIRAINETALDFIDFYWRIYGSPEPDAQTPDPAEIPVGLPLAVDSATAAAKALALEEAINSFVEAVRPELGD
jgi:hypothetical protein